MLVAEATRRQVDTMSIAEGRNTWADALPEKHGSHELIESQMNYLLRVNPEIGLLGGENTFMVTQFIGKSPRFYSAWGSVEHPVAQFQRAVKSFVDATNATRTVIIGISPVTETGEGGWGHWVCLTVNKYDGQTEFILLDSENRPVLDFRTESLLNAFTNEPGLKALLRDEISAIDLLIQCFTGKADMASIIADSLVGTPSRRFSPRTLSFV